MMFKNLIKKAAPVPSPVPELNGPRGRVEPRERKPKPRWKITVEPNGGGVNVAGDFDEYDEPDSVAIDHPQPEQFSWTVFKYEDGYYNHVKNGSAPVAELAQAAAQQWITLNHVSYFDENLQPVQYQEDQ